MPALLRRMTGRDTDERHRVSSPLELLFDLVYVVAISQAASGLAGAVEEGHVLAGVQGFLVVIFAVWWAWMNFTWFASAYDTDDVPYRILTLVQMAGSLIIAAGAHAVFEGGDLTQITVGYAIMRFALVAQWLRAAAQHPEGRRTALRYAGLVTLVQLLWIGRLFFPWGQDLWVFVLLALCEIAVPPIAEGRHVTPWHPHHIAERYGLFVIILLGESVAAATVAFSQAELSPAIVTIGAAGLVILFALWWIYFAQPSGEGLEQRRGAAWYWGYGHYPLFASLAAIGAGLEVAVLSTEHHLELGDRVIALVIALPIGAAVVLVGLVHVPFRIRLSVRGEVLALGAALVVGAAIAEPYLGLPGALAAMAVVLVLVVASTYLPRSADVEAPGTGAGASSGAGAPAAPRAAASPAPDAELP